MAKRGRPPKKKTATKATGTTNSRDNVNGRVILLIILAVILGIVIYTRQGYLGQTLSPALGGLVGYIKYFIPIGIGIFAIIIAHDKSKKYFSSKLFMFLVVLILIDCVLASYQFSKGNIDNTNDMDVILSKAYDLGSKDIGGGVLGTAVATFLTRMIGIPGTIVASIIISTILTIVIFGLKPADAISRSVDRLEERRMRKAQERKEHEESVPIEPPKDVNNTRKTRGRKEKVIQANPIDEQITINLNENQQYENAEKGVEVPNFSSNNPIKRKFGKAKDYKVTREEQLESKELATNLETNNNENSDSNLFAQEEIEKETKTKEVLQLEHALAEEDMNYEFPPIELLNIAEQNDEGNSRKALLATAEKLKRTLYSFGVSAKVENVSVGPSITRYELAPAAGVRVSKIAKLSDDIALSLEAETIRIEAPIPGKHTVGIEVPNKSKSLVGIREIIESVNFSDMDGKLAFALGKDIAGEAVVTDIAKMPHLLIAGSTGSGKSVCINTMITSLIYKAKPSEVKLLMVDPKVVELSIYNGIPHLLIPVVTDPKKAAGALAWAVQEMENRYALFAEHKVRDLKGYNKVAESDGRPTLPQIVIIIDELADLMMVAAKDVEDAICRLAQKARAAGMHLVIATQRPSVDVITGIIKANIPSRIAFAVSSQIDSRTILDGAGAEKLLGKGDLLFYPTGYPKPVRLQGAFISDGEVENIVKFIKKDGDGIYDESIIETIDRANEPEQVNSSKDEEDDGTDPLLEEAIELVVDTQKASTSYIQRRFKVGYARAGRIIDQMEERGIISGYQGSKPRQVLMPKERWEELKLAPAMDVQVEEDMTESAE